VFPITSPIRAEAYAVGEDEEIFVGDESGLTQAEMDIIFRAREAAAKRRIDRERAAKEAARRRRAGPSPRAPGLEPVPAGWKLGIPRSLPPPGYKRTARKFNGKWYHLLTKLAGPIPTLPGYISPEQFAPLPDETPYEDYPQEDEYFSEEEYWDTAGQDPAEVARLRTAFDALPQPSALAREAYTRMARGASDYDWAKNKSNDYGCHYGKVVALRAFLESGISGERAHNLNGYIRDRINDCNNIVREIRR
jgi:hypothetical protein